MITIEMDWDTAQHLLKELHKVHDWPGFPQLRIDLREALENEDERIGMLNAEVSQ